MMKKLLFSIFLISICFSGYCQSIKRTSGSLSFLKSANVIGVSFTYDNMIVGKLSEEEYVNKKVSDYNKKRDGWGDEWKTSWIGNRSDKFEPKFIELLSKYIAEKGVSVQSSGYEYEMVVNTDFIEPGFNIGITKKNASVNLTCRFIRKTDGSEVASITIKDASASSFWGDDYDMGLRIQEPFAKAGKELARFMIKDAKL